MSRHLAERGYSVANIEYRRVTDDDVDGVWSEMSSDVLAAIAGTPRLDGPTLLIGHSAGGQLALWAAAQSGLSVDGVVALAPVTDLIVADDLKLSDHATKELLGTTAVEQPDLYRSASPVHLLPLGVPQLVVHGQADQNVPFEMSEDFVNRARLAGDHVEVVDGADIDHFDVIDPKHDLWRSIVTWADSQL